MIETITMKEKGDMKTDMMTIQAVTVDTMIITIKTVATLIIGSVIGIITDTRNR